MSQTKVFIAAIIVILLGVAVSATLFTVDEKQQVIVMQFGNPQAGDPGSGTAL